MIKILKTTLIASTLGFTASQALAVPLYSVTDLGTFGGRYSYAYGINDSGQVVGHSRTSNGQIHAFLSDGSTMTDLGTLGGVIRLPMASTIAARWWGIQTPAAAATTTNPMPFSTTEQKCYNSTP